MNQGEILRTAMAEIRGHKLRSALTLLGIILGTLSITVMTSFLDGIVATVWDGISGLGFDGVMYVVSQGPRNLREQELFARSKGLQPADAGLLLARGGPVGAVAPVMYWEEVVARGGVERKTRVLGVTSAYSPVRNRKVGAGRFINEQDEEAYGRVCILGSRLARRLFGKDDPLDKTVTVAGRQFRVVGVGEDLSNPFVNDREFIEEMEGMAIPLSTLRKFYTGEDLPLAFIAVKAKDTDELDALKAEIVAAMTIAHRGAPDFRVENIAEEMLKARVEVKEQLRNWRVVLGTIAGISLIVGGIGLLSVMLISIGERMYEIGLRKAIGATDTQVFFQFLAEAVVLSLIGGLLGAALGVGVTKAFSGFFKTGLPINLPGLAFALGISVVLGVAYGIYPALKASRTAPVEALRSAA